MAVWRVVALTALLLGAAVPTVAACETEVANALEGKFPSPTGISPNKDDSIRESVRLASIGQHVAREMLWQVLMGANLTEAAIAAEIDRAMIENGSNPNWPSFSTIVASGANGAIPHGDPDNNGAGPKQVVVGDVVVVDLGARVNDWVSDVTRSYVVGGTTNATVLKAYMAVYDAQNLTFPLIEAGTPAWALDDIARTHIEEQGFGDEFIHSLGHGFGVCVHEPPCCRAARTIPCSASRTISNLWRRTMPSPSNPAFTSTGGSESASRTTFWSTKTTTNSSPTSCPGASTGS